MDFINLRDSFANPGIEYRPVPFWFWNSRLDLDEIERQIKLMAEAGLGGFFMHARFGLETEYMGDEWMSCIVHAVQVAKKCGLKAWLYDEYPFPSGVGGLEVTRNPEYCNKFIDLVEITVTGPKDVSIPLPEGEPLIAYAVPTALMSEFYEKAVELEITSPNQISWSAPQGQWQIMVFVKRLLQDPRGNVFGPDYLNPDMTEAFLGILDKYVLDQNLKDHLGKTIPGIFTDEPNLLAWHQNHTSYPNRDNARITVWGDQIPERLNKLGHDWRKVLPALFYYLGPNSKELRHAYWKCVSDNYIDSFFIPYQKWCKENNLKLTGHLLLEEGLYTNTIFQGDFIRDLSLFDIPGSDHLGIGCEDKYGGWGNLPLMSTNAQGQKLVSSIAHIHDKEAVLSESFGVSGWGLRMADMKRIVDWQYGLGINFLCPHAFYYSTEGFRKHDSPPSQFFQATYWPYYRHFADYVARLSLLMREGRHIAQAALFYPQDAFWQVFKAGKEDGPDRETADCFDLFASELPKCHVDYDIVPADFITPESIKDGVLKVNDEEYEIIVIPPVSYMSDQMVESLAKFYENGGKLLMGLSIRTKLLERIKSMASPKGKFFVLPGMEPNDLKPILDYLLIPDVKINYREIAHVHRELSSKHIYFFTNNSEKTLDANLEIKIQGRVEEWNLETGQISHISSEITEDGYMAIDWQFAPYGSLMLIIDPENQPLKKQTGAKVAVNAISLKDKWDFALSSPNALILDQWSLKVTTKGDWIHYDYITDVNMQYMPDSVLLMLDDIESRSSFMAGMTIKAYVNSKEIPLKDAAYYIDPKWPIVEIAHALRIGQNQIHLRFANQSWAGEPKGMTISPKLLGDFSLLKDENDKYIISGPENQILSGKSWTEQGYPFYSGTAIYKQEVLIDQEILSAEEVWIEAAEVYDMVEFMINDAPGAVRPWPPYSLNISPFLNSGKNIITLKVTNSMRNFIEGEIKPSGLLGSVMIIKKDKLTSQ